MYRGFIGLQLVFKGLLIYFKVLLMFILKVLRCLQRNQYLFLRISNVCSKINVYIYSHAIKSEKLSSDIFVQTALDQVPGHTMFKEWNGRENCYARQPIQQAVREEQFIKRC